MTSDITRCVLVQDREATAFVKRLSKEVERLQTAEGPVEVQYSQIDGRYSALLLVRGRQWAS